MKEVFQYPPPFYSRTCMAFDFPLEGMGKILLGSPQKNLLDFSVSDKNKNQERKRARFGIQKVFGSQSTQQWKKKQKQSSWGHNDPLTSLQIREMKKVSSWLLWCLFKELPVCCSLFYLSHGAAIGVHMIDVVSSLRLSRLPDEQILYQLRFGECV